MNSHGKQAVASDCSVEPDGVVVDEIADVCEEVSDGFSGKPSLAKSYADGNLCVHLHLRVRSRGVANPQDLCVVVDPPNRLREISDSAAAVGRSPWFVDLDGNVVVGESIETAERRLDHAMLVRVGQLSERVNGGRFKAALCPVRLSRVDACPVSFRDSFQPPVSHAWPPLSRSKEIGVLGGGNGELVEVTGRSAVEDYELPHEVVEGGSKVLDEVSEQQSPVGIDGPVEVDVDDMDDLAARLCHHFRLDVIGERVRLWVTQEEAIDLFAQGAQMGFCTRDLRPRAFQ